MNRILLVEDDYLNNLALHGYLQDAGFSVKSAFSGLGALAAITRAAPHALVSDLNLGPGPNGVEVARFARSVRPDTQIVLISSQLARYRALGDVAGAEFVAKPYRGEEIVAALQRATTPLAA